MKRTYDLFYKPNGSRTNEKTLFSEEKCARHDTMNELTNVSKAEKGKNNERGGKKILFSLCERGTISERLLI